ncbi:septal ring lytic transglycosylase RlpA family protein [soil metagenome]
MVTPILHRGARGVATAALGAMLGLALLLGGCASGPKSASSGGSIFSRLPSDRDGPEANPPAGLEGVPDAEPVVEPIRIGGPNKPYEVLGQQYVPITQDRAFTERGLASWYGRKFQGKRTSSGELYNMYAMTAAHPTLPIPSYARIRNPANGREVVVRINDRGPFHSSRIVDLSYTAALKLDILRGVTPVELERITFDDIRTGAWRRGAPVEPGADVRVAARSIDAAASAGAVRVTAATLPSAVPDRPTTFADPRAAAAAASGSTVASNPSNLSNPSNVIEPVAVIAADRPAAPAVAPPPVADAPPARAYTSPARGFWVQLGAFRQRDGAEGFQQRVASQIDWLTPLLAVFSDASMFRLQAGPYPTRDDARGVAERIREALQLVPVIVERR